MASGPELGCDLRVPSQLLTRPPRPPLPCSIGPVRQADPSWPFRTCSCLRTSPPRWHPGPQSSCETQPHSAPEGGVWVGPAGTSWWRPGVEHHSDPWDLWPKPPAPNPVIRSGHSDGTWQGTRGALAGVRGPGQFWCQCWRRQRGMAGSSSNPRPASPPGMVGTILLEQTPSGTDHTLAGGVRGLGTEPLEWALRGLGTELTLSC